VPIGCWVRWLAHGAFLFGEVAGIKESLFEEEIVAEYLLYRLNVRFLETGGKGMSCSHRLPSTPIPF
jgi:hypothetical protein